MNVIIEYELSNYLKIMLNKRPSRSKAASMIKVEKKDGINSLWNEHEHQRTYFKKMYHKFTFNDREKPDFSYLDLKIKISEKIFENCYFCEKKCYINRNKDK